LNNGERKVDRHALAKESAATTVTASGRTREGTVASGKSYQFFWWPLPGSPPELLVQFGKLG
jgi:hypothetical protein